MKSNVSVISKRIDAAIAVLVLCLLLSAFAGFGATQVFAAEQTTDTANANVVQANVEGYIAIASASAISFTQALNPNDTPNRELEGELNIKSNLAGGYQVSISSAAANSGALYHGSLAYGIALTLTSNKTAVADIGANCWGIRVSNRNDVSTFSGYYIAPAPLSATTEIIDTGNASQKTSLATGDEYKVKFGINIDNSLPVGTYTGAVTYSATAHV